MQLLKALQQLAKTDTSMPGKVESVSGTRIVAATPSGKIEVDSMDSLNPGDLVVITGGQARKKQRGGKAPVYYV